MAVLISTNQAGPTALVRLLHRHITNPVSPASATPAAAPTSAPTATGDTPWRRRPSHKRRHPSRRRRRRSRVPALHRSDSRIRAR